MARASMKYCGYVLLLVVLAGQMMLMVTIRKEQGEALRRGIVSWLPPSFNERQNDAAANGDSARDIDHAVAAGSVVGNGSQRQTLSASPSDADTDKAGDVGAQVTQALVAAGVFLPSTTTPVADGGVRADETAPTTAKGSPGAYTVFDLLDGGGVFNGGNERIPGLNVAADASPMAGAVGKDVLAVDKSKAVAKITRDPYPWEEPVDPTRVKTPRLLNIHPDPPLEYNCPATEPQPPKLLPKDERPLRERILDLVLPDHCSNFTQEIYKGGHVFKKFMWKQCDLLRPDRTPHETKDQFGKRKVYDYSDLHQVPVRRSIMTKSAAQAGKPYFDADGGRMAKGDDVAFSDLDLKELPLNLTWNRCALVANSGAMLRSEWGQEIDDHDIVYRFNYAKISGFEKYVGSKTTVQAFWSAFIKNYTQILTQKKGDQNVIGLLGATRLHDIRKFVMAKRTTPLLGSNPRFVMIGDEVRRLGTAIYCHFTDGGAHWWAPTRDKTWSTGFITMLHAISMCNQVDMYGFLSEPHDPYHYYDKTLPNGDRLTKNAKVRWDGDKSHWFDMEHRIMSLFHDNGIINLKPRLKQ